MRTIMRLLLCMGLWWAGAPVLRAAPPANDTCAGAVLLTENVEHTQRVTNATADVIVYQGRIITNRRGGVWLRYVAPTDGELVVSTRYATTSFAVLTGECSNATAILYDSSSWSIPVQSGQTFLLCSTPENATNQLGVRLFTAPHPVNDTCSNALPLAENVFMDGDISGAQDDNSPCGAVQKGLWYTYTAPWTGTTRVDMVVANNQYFHYGTVFTGDCGALSNVECWSAGLFDNGFRSTAGTTYKILLGSYGGFGMGAFQVRARTTPPPPVNDACSAAAPLAEGVYATRLTVAAHDDTGLVAGVISRGTWFTYTPAFSGMARIDTCPSDFGTKLEVFSGPCGALQPVAALDESATCGGARAAVSFPCAAGITYRICAGGTNGAAGTLYLLAESEPLTNNTDCAAAGILFDRQPLVQNTAGFPDAASTCAGTISNAAWFTFTASRTGTAVVETCGSEFATQVEAFSGDCSNLVSLGCASSSSACSNRAALSFPCASGATYRICAGGSPNGGLLRIVARAIGPRVPNDFDGDGRTDQGVYDPFDGSWSLQLSNGGQWRTSDVRTVQFGFSGTHLIEGDFDGDGLADPALFEPATYRWFLGRSQAGYTNFTFGYMGATPVTADFDGDGRTDVALFEPARGRWSVRNSTTGPTNFTYGIPGSMPAVADFDGDGRADPGYYRPDDGLWRVQLSGGGTLQTNFCAMIVFANGTTERAIPLPADYDGDGLADLAVLYANVASNQFRVRRTTLGRVDVTTGWTPIRAGDYDGDGAADLCAENVVYNPGRSTFTLPPLTRDLFGRRQALGDIVPLLERQFAWPYDLPLFSGSPITPISGKTSSGRSFRIQFQSAGKNTTGVFTDASGATAPIYLSGFDGNGFADSAGTASTGPLCFAARVTRQDTFPLGVLNPVLSFYYLAFVTMEGTYRDQRGESPVKLTFVLYGFASP